MQQTVRPMAEHGLPAQQAESLAALNAQLGELQTSVADIAALHAAVTTHLGAARRIAVGASVRVESFWRTDG